MKSQLKEINNFASAEGKEELISVIISLLPFELRMKASTAYDYACLQ